jgi:hypothetical protein
MQASDVKDSNPYVAVVAKKHRNLKKKYGSLDSPKDHSAR